MMTKRMEFYSLACVIGLSQGGIQALSRSYFSRLIPPDKTAEYFGFYNMLGKFAVIFGPALMGLTGLAVKKALMPPSPSAYETGTYRTNRIQGRHRFGQCFFYCGEGSFSFCAGGKKLIDAFHRSRENRLKFCCII